MTVALAFILALLCSSVSLVFTSKLTNCLKENGHETGKVFHSYNLFSFIRFLRKEDDPQLKRKYLRLHLAEMGFFLAGMAILIILLRYLE